jgi:DNA-binding MarR family transcriptional regulator
VSAAIRNTAGGDDHGDLDNLVTALLGASRVLIAVSARSLAEVESKVTLTQVRTLVLLSNHDGINLNTLADLLQVNASTAMRMIDRLLVAGLVTRRDNPQNRREVLLGLTPAGRRIVRKVTTRRRAEIERIVAEMPTGHRATLVKALQAFAKAAGEPEPAALTALGW